MITSGAVIPIIVFDKVGYFNEDFLIYHVDTEFCKRVRFNGYRIIAFTGIQLFHSEGFKQKMKIGFVLNNYSAQSTYYIIRNTILLWKLYPYDVTFKEKCSFFKYKIVYRLVKLIFEKDRLLKSKAIFSGLVHGYLARKGRHDM